MYTCYSWYSECIYIYIYIYIYVYVYIHITTTTTTNNNNNNDILPPRPAKGGYFADMIKRRIEDMAQGICMCVYIYIYI